MFEGMDLDGDGLLAMHDLTHFFNHTVGVVSNTDYLSSRMSGFERRDPGGRLNYEEFKAVFIPTKDVKPFVVVHNNVFEKNMAYFAGNAFHITSTLSFTADFDDYLQMCGSGILIDGNSFVGNIGMKRHNGGAGVIRCVRSSDEDDYFLRRGWTSGYKLGELEAEEETEEDFFSRAFSVGFLVDLWDIPAEDEDPGECDGEWAAGRDCVETIEVKYFENPSTSYVNVTDLFDS